MLPHPTVVSVLTANETQRILLSSFQLDEVSVWVRRWLRLSPAGARRQHPALPQPLQQCLLPPKFSLSTYRSQSKNNDHLVKF